MSNENLENFSGWDKNVPEIDFFGESPDPVETEQDSNDLQENKNDGKEKDQEENNKAETKEKDPEIDFFGEDQEESEKTISSKEEDDISVESDNSISTVNFLKERGLIDFELDENTALTSELAEEILEDSFDEKVEDRVKELFDELPQVVKDLNKFVIKGGNADDFFKSFAKQNTSNISLDIDLTKESNQELIIKNQLKSEGYDDDYISSHLEFLKDSDNLKKIAETHFNKWKAKNEKEQARLLKEQDDKAKLEKENRRKFKNKVTNFISETEELNGVYLSKSDKRTLPNYMTDRTVKLQNGGAITSMQRDLYAALQDDSKAVLIAKLLKNDFNFKDIEINAQTKVTKKIKENIRRNKADSPSKSATNNSQKQVKNLVDYF